LEANADHQALALSVCGQPRRFFAIIGEIAGIVLAATLLTLRSAVLRLLTAMTSWAALFARSISALWPVSELPCLLRSFALLIFTRCPASQNQQAARTRS
jgi:hypothetical protein